MNNISKVESVAPFIHNPAYPCTCNVHFEGNQWSIRYCQIHGSGPELSNALQVALATIERMEVNHGPFSSCQGTKDVIHAALKKAGAL